MAQATIPAPMINGLMTDHSCFDCDLGGFDPGKGVKSINWDSELDPGEPRGADPVILGTTRGTYKCTAKVELWKAFADQFEAYIYANANGSGLYEAQWDATINILPSSSLPVSTTVLKTCRIKKATEQSTNNNEHHFVSYDLHVTMKFKNNIPDVSSTAQFV